MKHTKAEMIAIVKARKASELKTNKKAMAKAIQELSAKVVDLEARLTAGGL